MTKPTVFTARQAAAAHRAMADHHEAIRELAIRFGFPDIARQAKIDAVAARRRALARLRTHIP